MREFNCRAFNNVVNTKIFHNYLMLIILVERIFGKEHQSSFKLGVPVYFHETRTVS